MLEDGPVASGSGAVDIRPPNQTTAEGCLDCTDDEADAEADLDADADGESDTNHEEDEGPGHLAEQAPTEANQSQGRPLIWKTTKTDAQPTWSKGFSKFRVELPPTPPPPPTAQDLMKMDDHMTFRAFKPKTTPSAIGRILAHNPQISVDAFSEILEADGSNVRYCTFVHV